jgi:hypothetical protein
MMALICRHEQVFCAGYGNRVTTNAVQFLGGYGFRDYPGKNDWDAKILRSLEVKPVCSGFLSQKVLADQMISMLRDFII